MHSPVEHSPCYSARVLALEEKRFGLAILEAENLAVAADVELALSVTKFNQSLHRTIEPRDMSVAEF